MAIIYIGLWIAKALKTEEKTSGQVRDVKPQRGGPCSNDNLCHNHCPGCRFTQCVDGECVCSICYTPPTDLGVKSHIYVTLIKKNNNINYYD